MATTRALRTLILSAPLALALAGPAFAADGGRGYGPPPGGQEYTDWRPNTAAEWWTWQRKDVLPAKAVVRRLEQQSYRDVERLALKGNTYVARAEDRRGREVKLTVDAYTAQVLRVDYVGRNSFLTFAKIEKQLYRDGYRKIENAGFDNGNYRVTAISARGQKVRLIVDAQTGRIEQVRVLRWAQGRQPSWYSNDTGWTLIAQDAVRDDLERQRYTRISRFRHTNDVYVVDACDRRGKDVRLTIDAYSGRIVDSRFL